MSMDQRNGLVPPPPTLRQNFPFVAPLLLALPAILVGIVLANLPGAVPLVKTIGICLLIAGVGLHVVGVVVLLTQTQTQKHPESGPYVLVPTPLTWRQLGYPNHQSHHWEALTAYVNGDLLDIIGTLPSYGAVSASVLRSRLVAVRARRVQIEGEPWWGIAMERVEKPDDLEFGIRDDQRDVAAAEQRAIEVAAQLTRAMRVEGARQ